MAYTAEGLMSPGRPTDDEIARVQAWEAAECRRLNEEASLRRAQMKAENQKRIRGYFTDKRILEVHLMQGTNNHSSDEVWGLRLRFEDGSRVDVDACDGHIELAYKAARSLSVDECPTCEGGLTVRYCPVHGLGGSAPR